ncbi:uncharacterized protein LOC134836845 isoform X2 [Culicoides brevitarsis]|uniref:uncharacterized protein LOC134836845 isoform X2 n=1 Tax=Culicoides brevitarsis TaxID=469753 RepID=UPI00307C2E5A
MTHLFGISLILSSCYVGLAFSLPVKSFIIAERSVVILGLISCISVGALLGACLFCKRRKRKFELNKLKDLEKFENEGNLATDPNAVPSNSTTTAYPIFRALTTSSPEISRVQPAVIVAQTPTNRSSDNLLDSNNGDTDNNNGIISQSDMENIENNNATDYIPALMAVQHRAHEHGTELIVENEIRAMSRAPACVSPPEQQTTSLTQPTSTSLEECSLTSVSILMPPDPFDDCNFNNLSREVVEQKFEIACERNSFVVQQLSEDTTSVSSLSSGSPEINSVEEALRALDIAIEGEDVSPEDENCHEYSPDELLDVIVQEIKNDCMGISKQLASNDVDTVVREEAQTLVDDVLGKAQQLYEVLTTHKSLELPKEDLKVEENDEFVFQKPLPVSLKPQLSSQLTIEQDEDPFESFSSQLLDCTSTPAFGQKTFSRQEHTSVVQKLNFGDESSPAVANNECTFDVSMPQDATFEVPNKQNSPPVITVDVTKDLDANSDEMLPTITPVNTPNELNFPTETWNKIVAKNLMKNRPADADLDLVPANVVFDRTFDKTFEKNELIDTDADNVGGGWFLHPQIVPKFNDLGGAEANQQLGDATFDVPGDEIDDDEEDFNADFRDKSIEALRMHLAATLGNAGAAFGGPTTEGQHSDDDDDLSGSRSNETFDTKYGDVDEATNVPVINKTEIVVNYNKRSLSPIMEESEDDLTCKTFVCAGNNETQRLDSTSTGLVETSEAIMGVTKTLMASNDTLYNFEDPLNDENIFSPRTQSQNEVRSDAPFAIKYPLEPLPLQNLDVPFNQTIDLDKTPTGPQRPFELPLQLDRIDVNDVLSPDQEPDLTYTVDEKTYVTVKHNSLKLPKTDAAEDERISEISEPDLVSTSSAHDKFLKTEDDENLTSIEEDLPEEMYRPCENVAETVILPEDDSEEEEESEKSDATPKNDEENEQSHDRNDEPPTVSSSDTQALVIDSSFSTTCDSNNLSPSNFQQQTMPYQNENVNFLNSEIRFSSINGENKAGKDSSSSVVVKTKALVADLNNGNGVNGDWNGIHEKIYSNGSPVKMETVNNKEKSTSSALDSINLLLNKHRENNYVIHEIDFESIGEGPLIGLSLSGEEDPWVATDIRVAAPCQELMSTSFTTNDWESEEEESSNSSEEFMYMYVRNKETNKETPGMTEIQIAEEPEIEEKLPEVKEEVLWSPHKDQIPVIGEENEEQQEGQLEQESSATNSDSEDEGEFVPSSWDSMALPARSALKSPDKILDEEPKKRRNVAFKVQRYHSVYEYPKEVIELSPAYSEPQLWKHSFETFMEAQRREPPTPQQLDTDLDEAAAASVSSNAGFSVSCSTRPFHCNQFNHAQCNTWPGDQNDFSWSQIEETDVASDDSKMFQGSSFIDWPKHLTEDGASLDNSSDRPDSGVGESVEFSNTDASLSLGAMRHAKDFLKLPLCTINITPSPEQLSALENENDEEPEEEVAAVEMNYVKITNGTDFGTDDEKEASSDAILPTPSCTGSMDSLSSSNSSMSASENRSSKGQEVISTIRRVDKKDTLNTQTATKRQFDGKLGRLSARLSDSTDEDSGIENLTRISK